MATRAQVRRLPQLQGLERSAVDHEFAVQHEAGLSERGQTDLAVINLLTGHIEHRLPIEGVVEELYDVAVLPGVIPPSVIGFRSDEIRFLVRPAGA